MPKIKTVRLSTEDLHKLKKHKTLRIGNYRLKITDIDVHQVKIYG